jgi:hypothetical protein
MVLPSLVQVLAEDADQEDRDDVGQDHRDDAAGRGEPTSNCSSACT